MKSCLILGGSRFLGPNLSEALQSMGYQVTHFRRGITTPPYELANVSLIRGDRNSPVAIATAFQNSTFDLVIDLSGYDVSQIQPIFQFRNRFARYLFCSTSSVIDNSVTMPYDEGSSRTKSLSSYGGKKLAIEDFLLNEYEKNKTPITIFRPQGIFGRYDFAQPGAIFKALQQNETLTVSPEKWRAKLNLLDVNDFCTALLSSIEKNQAFGKIYNIANSEPISLQDLVQLCGNILQITPKIELQGGGPNWWHDYDLIAANHRIRNELGITFTPLETSLLRVKKELQVLGEPGFVRRMQRIWQRLTKNAMR